MVVAGDGQLPTARRWEASASARASGNLQLPAGAAAAQALGAAALEREFSRIDADQDGVISRSEFLFDRIDRNHDGVISRSEFDAALAAPQSASAPKEPVRSGSTTAAAGSVPWPSRGLLQRSANDLDSSVTGWQSLDDIEALEHSKTEHYVAQVTLSREQMALFSRELERLQHQVAQILGAGGAATSLRELAETVGYLELSCSPERLARLERSVGDLQDKHGRLAQDMRGQHAPLPERVAALEQHCGQLLDQHSEELARLRGMPDRLDRLARDLGDPLGRHADLLAELQGGRAAQERALAEARAAQERAQAEAIAQVAERLERETLDRQEALADLASSSRAAVLEVRAELGTGMRGLAELRRSQGELREALEERHAPLVEGLALLEKDFAELRRSHLEFGEALDARHALLVDRLAPLEKDSSETRRSHGEFREALQAAQAAHALLVDRLAFVEKDSSEMRRSHGEFCEALESEHALLVDRLALVEKDSSELRRSHGEFREALDAGHALLVDRLAFLEKEIGASAEAHLSTCDRSFEVVRQSLDERVARLEQETLAEPASACRGGAAPVLAEPLAGAAPAVSLAARVASVERGLGESAARHARYAEEQSKAMYEYHGHHVAIEERVRCVEQACGDAASTWQNHALDLRRLWEHVSSAQAQRHESGTAAVKARLDALEKLHEQDTRSMDLLVDCLQKELRNKSELLDRIRRSNELSLMKADRENSFGCAIDCSPPPTARPHPHTGPSPELARQAK